MQNVINKQKNFTQRKTKRNSKKFNIEIRFSQWVKKNIWILQQHTLHHKLVYNKRTYSIQGVSQRVCPRHIVWNIHNHLNIWLSSIILLLNYCGLQVSNTDKIENWFFKKVFKKKTRFQCISVRRLFPKTIFPNQFNFRRNIFPINLVTKKNYCSNKFDSSKIYFTINF